MRVIWQVVIPVGRFMCGTHTFNTKKSAFRFVSDWANANPNPDGSKIYHDVRRLQLK